MASVSSLTGAAADPEGRVWSGSVDVFSRGAAGAGALAKPDEAGFVLGWGTGEVWSALAAVLTFDGGAA
ncbi:hypothetical protein RMQ97_04675 [Maricaulis sp. D1M11]|uniref:hypothetical protein n=1 Tax=Maricaulis sp. D1M11 TaxID=3076117 RepID=UPI0039B5592E